MVGLRIYALFTSSGLKKNILAKRNRMIVFAPDNFIFYIFYYRVPGTKIKDVNGNSQNIYGNVPTNTSSL